MKAAQTLPAIVTRDGAGRPVQAHVWCEWCEDIHHHGPHAGHRGAHCHRDDSPHRGVGYVLAITGNAAAFKDVRPAGLLIGTGRLAQVLVTGAPALRRALMRPILGRLLQRRVGRARISVKGRAWWIEPDAFPTNAELTAPIFRPRPTASGEDLATLLGALYGLSLGVVAVRLLETVSGLQLDARAKVAIAAEVEAFRARQAGGGE